MRSFLLLLLLLGASAPQAEEVWTLYRNAPGAPQARVHVATFDAYLEHRTAQPIGANRQNCWLAAELFRLRSGSVIRYWCEHGRHAPR